MILREAQWPEGWTTLSLGAVCEIVNGGTPKTNVNEYWGGKHLWITPAEMGKRLSPYVDDTERKLTDSGLRDSSARMLPKNSVILSSRAPIGHLVINTKPMSTNQGCKGLIPGKHIECKYLYYYLGSIVELLNSLGSGATFKEISGGKLKEVTIPVPPLPEQKRIVAILDKAFEGIALARANAERNLRNAREVFESYLNEVFTRRGEGWEEKRLGDICEIGDGNYSSKYPKASEFLSDGVPFITATNLKNGTISPDDMRYISHAQHTQLIKGHVRSGDLVIVVRGSSTGNSSLVQHKFSGSNLNSQLAYLRSKGKISSELLYYSFNSPLIQKKVKNEISGSAQPQLPNNKLLNIAISYPLGKEQQDVLIAKLDLLKKETQCIEGIYQQKLSTLDELKKSLLNKAFNGEL